MSSQPKSSLWERVSSSVLLFLICAFLLMPVCQWVLNMCGLDVYNPLTEEGLRSLFMNVTQMLIPPSFGLFLLSFTAIGMLIGSGLIQSFGSKATILQRRGRRNAMFVVLFGAVLFLMLYLWPGSPVLSLSGNFKHSPLIHGLPMLIAVTLMLASLTYASSCRQIHNASDVARLICYGLRTYTTWFYILMLILCLL